VSEAVLDASVLVAAISPHEIHHAAARRLYESYSETLAFVVPSLFRLEVLSALARRGEPGELLDTVEVLVSGPRFHTVTIDETLIALAMRVARTGRLRAYDAVYAALALDRKASLFTLDSDVRSRISVAFPSLSLVTPS